MKIVSYNINGLRPRISQFGSLLKLLDSLDADIICFQETKLSRQDLTADLVIADGYECFFSCTRSSNKGRVAYSGVATFCRVKSAFSSNEVALPLAAEEGFTGILETLHVSRAKKDGTPPKMKGLEEHSKDELMKVDSEGRCVITDHGHFVLFNIYGPRAECDDMERNQFKLTFFQILEKRWEFLLHQGRRVFVVGDLNIAPAAIDCCNPGPDFDNNKFRTWFRSLLVENGGPFFDVFRAKHPERREAYTQWRQNTGAEEFNYGSRIDHILIAGPCLHEDQNQQSHNIVTCHIKECDILTQFRRWRPGNSPRWKGGRSIKLEGSDHVPVYMDMVEVPDILQHSTPSLSARYAPEVRGLQQTIVSVLMKRQLAEQVKTCGMPSSFSGENVTKGNCSGSVKRSFTDCNGSSLLPEAIFCSSNLEPGAAFQSKNSSESSPSEDSCNNMTTLGNDHVKLVPEKKLIKKGRQSQWSQLSLKSFFQKSLTSSDCAQHTCSDLAFSQADVLTSDNSSKETYLDDHINCSPKQLELNDSASAEDPDRANACCTAGKEKSNVALLEWQRIQQLMQSSIPLCKGHSEPCVARVVKKPGPTFGRRFYVCARAEGPASNPETNCGYFKWVASKSKRNG